MPQIAKGLLIGTIEAEWDEDESEPIVVYSNYPHFEFEYDQLMAFMSGMIHALLATNPERGELTLTAQSADGQGRILVMGHTEFGDPQLRAIP